MYISLRRSFNSLIFGLGLIESVIFVAVLLASQAQLALASNKGATNEKKAKTEINANTANTANTEKIGMTNTVWDESINVDFHDRLTAKPSGALSATRLCTTLDSQSGISKPNTKTIRDLLGPKLKSIDILESTRFETHALFYVAREAVSDALQKSPKTIYRYEPWANAVSPNFIGRLNYADGKTGELFLAYGYICFQDHKGTHWWARLTSPDDLNLKQIHGVIGFESGHGFFIDENSSHRIWLQMAEAKLLVRDLQGLMNKPAVVTGELRRAPKNVTTSIPSGADYFVYGFTVVPAVK